jgi:hypothetical protein
MKLIDTGLLCPDLVADFHREKDTGFAAAAPQVQIDASESAARTQEKKQTRREKRKSSQKSSVDLLAVQPAAKHARDSSVVASPSAATSTSTTARSDGDLAPTISADSSSSVTAATVSPFTATTLNEPSSQSARISSPRASRRKRKPTSVLLLNWADKLDQEEVRLVPRTSTLSSTSAEPSVAGSVAAPAQIEQREQSKQPNSPIQSKSTSAEAQSSPEMREEHKDTPSFSKVKSRHSRLQQQCPHCAYTSGRCDSLKNHIRTHTGERPFECPHCPYKASQSRNLRKHLQKHALGSLHCTHIGCTFVALQPRMLKSHLYTHKSESYQCPRCIFETKCERTLQIHAMQCVQSHHSGSTSGQLPYGCPLCPFKTVTIHSLHQHIGIHVDATTLMCQKQEVAASRSITSVYDSRQAASNPGSPVLGLSYVAMDKSIARASPLPTSTSTSAADSTSAPSSSSEHIRLAAANIMKTLASMPLGGFAGSLLESTSVE